MVFLIMLLHAIFLEKDQKAYVFFTEEKFDNARELIINAIEQYPQDALIPKFELLNAFITGKTAGKEVMILQLQQIVFNYDKTAEGEKAKKILSYLKSDLEGNSQSKEIKEANTNCALDC